MTPNQVRLSSKCVALGKLCAVRHSTRNTNHVGIRAYLAAVGWVHLGYSEQYSEFLAAIFVAWATHAKMKFDGQ